jgi:hypothetical protein
MKVFKALFKLIHNLTREEKVIVTENFSGLEEQDFELEEVEPPETEDEYETIIHNKEVSNLRDWAVKKINNLHEADRHRNAKALAAEFDEWILIADDVDELEYLSIENPGWTEDREIDVK